MDAPQSGQEPHIPEEPVAEIAKTNDVVTATAFAPPQTTGEGDEAGPGPSSAALPPPAAEPQPAEDEEEEDPLVVAQREQEEQEKALEEALNIQPYDDVDMRVRLRKYYNYFSVFVF